jgi:hypothetical protein
VYFKGHHSPTSPHHPATFHRSSGIHHPLLFPHVPCLRSRERSTPVFRLAGLCLSLWLGLTLDGIASLSSFYSSPTDNTCLRSTLAWPWLWPQLTTDHHRWSESPSLIPNPPPICTPRCSANKHLVLLTPLHCILQYSAPRCHPGLQLSYYIYHTRPYKPVLVLLIR